ncbi:MAG: hypothetical protein C5B49_15110 [Bdellovibrio sp.]|nr:MAG: hypothetical protein C5B49_15110 [Bdellovibrio sp.]
MKYLGKDFIFKADRVAPWWQSHTMAPTAILLGETIRVFLGCWDSNGISRIGFIDLQAGDPKMVKAVSDAPVLEIGRPGTFDDNGVFPGHAYAYDGQIYLYYTGFQLSDKVRHFNFGGLAISKDGKHFLKTSEAPILDRADEGLHVRAGQSVIYQDHRVKSCYSAGTGWLHIGGELRPVYDVHYQESNNFTDFKNKGTRIIECNLAVEHGLGRPQICSVDNEIYVFYTRRMLDMKYYFGYAKLVRNCGVAEGGDLEHGSWHRLDSAVTVPFGRQGEFDSDMIYFPSFLQVGNRKYVFYSGNEFGKGGLGVIRFA